MDKESPMPDVIVSFVIWVLKTLSLQVTKTQFKLVYTHTHTPHNTLGSYELQVLLEIYTYISLHLLTLLSYTPASCSGGLPPHEVVEMVFSSAQRAFYQCTNSRGKSISLFSPLHKIARI